MIPQGNFDKSKNKCIIICRSFHYRKKVEKKYGGNMEYKLVYEYIGVCSVIKIWKIICNSQFINDFFWWGIYIYGIYIFCSKQSYPIL